MTHFVPKDQRAEDAIDQHFTMINLREANAKAIADGKAREVEAMKAVMASMQHAEEDLPSKHANEIINDLVDFIMDLTDGDGEAFSRSIRAVTDGLVELRAKHTNYKVFREDDAEELTPHQLLVRELQRTKSIVTGSSFEIELNDVLVANGFKLRGFENPIKPAEAVAPTDDNVAAPTVSNDSRFLYLEGRLNDLENRIMTQLTEISAKLSK